MNSSFYDVFLYTFLSGYGLDIFKGLNSDIDSVKSSQITKFPKFKVRYHYTVP